MRRNSTSKYSAKKSTAGRLTEPKHKDHQFEQKLHFTEKDLQAASQKWTEDRTEDGDILWA